MSAIYKLNKVEAVNFADCSCRLYNGRGLTYKEIFEWCGMECRFCCSF